MDAPRPEVRASSLTRTYMAKRPVLSLKKPSAGFPPTCRSFTADLIPSGLAGCLTPQLFTHPALATTPQAHPSVSTEASSPTISTMPPDPPGIMTLRNRTPYYSWGISSPSEGSVGANFDANRIEGGPHQPGFHTGETRD